MREPDFVIDGEFPVWKCDGGFDFHGPRQPNGRLERLDCSKRAIYAEHGRTLGSGHYLGAITCAEHRWTGAITANHTAHWFERLPERFPLSVPPEGH